MEGVVSVGPAERGVFGLAMAARGASYRHRPEPHSGTLRTSRYDQVAGVLLTTLVVLGTVTLLMFMVWLSNRLFWTPPAVPVTVLEDVGGGGSGQVYGSEQQLEEPSATEVAQPAEVSIAQTLDSISTVVAAKAQDIE